VAALRQLGAEMEFNDRGEVTLLKLSSTTCNDDGLANLQALPKLKQLYLESTPITDAG